jgi:hypothetical protein
VATRRKKAPPSQLARVSERFGLSAEEQALLAALEAKQPQTVAALGAALLGPRGRLRRHALVHVRAMHGEAGAAAAGDEVWLGPALFDAEAIGPSVRRVVAEDAALPSARAIALVRGELPGERPSAVAIENCGRVEAYGLAVAIARFAGRAVLFADGEALMAQGASWSAIAALRREADLDGAALVIANAAALGERWRALAAPPAEHASAPVLVVLAGAKEIFGEDGIELVTLAMAQQQSAPAAEKAAPREDGFDAIRQQAVRDAERALKGMRLATAPAPTQTPTPTPTQTPVEEKAIKRSKKGEQYFGAAAAAPVAEPTAGESPEELARISTTSADAGQRIDAINKLAGHRSPAAVAALRANLRSEHAGVRSAAERAMAELFGPEWNRLRPVTKPVQPPRSED